VPPFVGLDQNIALTSSLSLLLPLQLVPWPQIVFQLQQLSHMLLLLLLTLLKQFFVGDFLLDHYAKLPYQRTKLIKDQDKFLLNRRKVTHRERERKNQLFLLFLISHILFKSDRTY